MHDYDAAKSALLADPTAVVVDDRSDSNKAEFIYVATIDQPRSVVIARQTLNRLVREGWLLPAPRLTPERWYVHAQPDLS